jgi:hypothetical protein
MQFIIKPLGAALILVSVATLSFLAVRAQQPSSATAGVRGNTGSLPSGSFSQEIPVVPAGSSKWQLSLTSPGEGNLKIVPVRDSPARFKQAVRLTVAKPVPEKFWFVQAQRQLPFPVNVGEQYALRFWARSPKGGAVQVVFEESNEPYYKDLSSELRLASEWKQYTLPFKVKRSYAIGESQLCLQVGRAEGTYEFSQVELVAQK